MSETRRGSSSAGKEKEINAKRGDRRGGEMYGVCSPRRATTRLFPRSGTSGATTPLQKETNRAPGDCFVLQRLVARVQSPFRPLLTRLRLFHTRVLPLAIVHHSMRANCRYLARSSTGGHLLSHFHAVRARSTLLRLRPFPRRSNIYNYREGYRGACARAALCIPPLYFCHRLFLSL